MDRPRTHAPMLQRWIVHLLVQVGLLPLGLAALFVLATGGRLEPARVLPAVLTGALLQAVGLLTAVRWVRARRRLAALLEPGHTALLEGRPDEAATHFAAALDRADARLGGYARLALADALLRKGEPAAASREAHLAAAAPADHGEDLTPAAGLRTALGWILSGELAHARTILDWVEALLADGAGYSRPALRAMLGAARMLLALREGEPRRAVELHERHRAALERTLCLEELRLIWLCRALAETELAPPRETAATPWLSLLSSTRGLPLGPFAAAWPALQAFLQANELD
jgi:hypothetical protein